MALRYLPIEHELVVYSGTDTRREYRWLPDGTHPQDFTGWKARIHVGPLRGGCVLHLTTENGYATLSADGVLGMWLTAEQSKTLTIVNPSYAVDLKDPDGIVTRLVRGRITLVKDIGREGFPAT